MARTLTQRWTEPGQTPLPSTGAGSSDPNTIGEASGDPSVTKVWTGQPGWFESAVYESTVPRECATRTLVSSPISGSMRRRSWSRRSGSVVMVVTMSTVRSNVASPAAWLSTRDGVPALEVGQRFGDTGPRHLELAILFRAGVAAEEVAVEAHRHVVLVEIDPVVPQTVADSRHPAAP